MTAATNRISRRLAVALAVVAVVGLGVLGAMRMLIPHAKSYETAGPAKAGLPRYVPTAAEWASLTIEPVAEHQFRAEHATEGKIAVNEDSSTPIFSPFAGRVTKLLVKPSDKVERGQPLFIVEATDTVQGLNDFVAALGALNSARSKLNLAQNDVRSAETALEAVHNRLRILGRSEEQISAFQETRQISADTPINSPIAGTVVQRKVGPGQYISTGASDPVFVIGDLLTVWLTAFVRETEASGVAVGQEIAFSLLAMPGSQFKARIDYVAAAIDPATRRLLVRATIDNKDGLFKPEMFANVTIFSGGERPSVGVPKQALIYEGERVRLWVAHDDKSIELRNIQPGLTNGDLVEVRTNLKAGEKIVTRGSLFIDRAASGS